MQARDRRSPLERHELLVGYAILAGMAGIAVGVVVALVQGTRNAPIDAALLSVGALAIAFGWQALANAAPMAPPLVPPAAATPVERPPSLQRVENAVAFGCGRAVDAHALLRPILRDIAVQRLSAYGVDLDTDARAPVMLGPWAWALLRPDLAEPSDRQGPGLDPAALERIVEALERL